MWKKKQLKRVILKSKRKSMQIIILIKSNARELASAFISTSPFGNKLLFMKVPQDASGNPTRSFWNTD